VTPRVLGLFAVFLALVIDQGHKHWMLYTYDIGARQPVSVTPWFDLVLVFNTGISYSWLQVHPLILLALMATAVLFLAIWLWRAGSALTTFGLGLIIGGALGNAYDRWQYGAVADFFYFHMDTERYGRLSWYVFNLADVAIVAGVALLLYETLFTGESRQDRADGAAG